MCARRTNDERSRTTRAGLVAAARRQFAEHGYPVTSMQDIAAAADVSTGALYHHWSGKKPLLEAVVNAIHQDLAREVAAGVPAEADPLVRLEHAAAAFLGRCVDADVGRILVREAPGILGETWNALDQRWWQRPTAALLRQAQDSNLLVPADPDGLATALLGSLTALGRTISLREPGCTPQTATALFHILITGIRR